MLSRFAAAMLAVAGSASAFAPMMSMSDMGRREIVQAGAATAVAAPLLRPSKAEAEFVKAGKINKAENGGGKAPIITIFDHRGCTAHANAEYKGKFTFGQDDEMCVKVQMQSIPRSNARATAQLQESISLKAKGIDGPYSATGTYGK